MIKNFILKETFENHKLRRLGPQPRPKAEAAVAPWTKVRPRPESTSSIKAATAATTVAPMKAMKKKAAALAAPMKAMKPMKATAPQPWQPRLDAALTMKALKAMRRP